MRSTQLKERTQLKLVKKSVRFMSSNLSQTVSSETVSSETVSSETVSHKALVMALKEWSVAVDALAGGETILLLRKGGIKEENGKFSAEADSAVLLPTFEHQKPELLKPAYREAARSVESGWHPASITLTAWADITDIFLTDDAEKVAALSEFHIWQANLAQARLKWKPKQPLYVLALRVYRLPAPVTIRWDEAYGGCRSWATLKVSVETAGSEAAIATEAYRAQVDAIAQTLNP